MTRGLRSFLLLLVVSMTGCAAPAGRSLATITPVQIIAADTDAPTPTPPIKPTLTPAALPTTTPTQTALPAATDAGSFASAPGAPAFRDCALTPGWVGCDPSKPALGGQLAFVDRAAMRVVALDLRTSASWQSAGHPSWLDWSPDGDRLLLGHRTDGGMEYNLLRGGAELPAPPASETALRWQPGGELGSVEAIQNEQGEVVRLEWTGDMRWLLHVTPQNGAPRTAALEDQPTDRLYALVSWVPGTELVLAQAYYASNAALTAGGQLLTINTLTGEQQMLDALAPLDGSAMFRWSPAPGSRQLAFIASAGGERSMGGPLGVIDFATMLARYPLPEAVEVTGFAWTPTGTEIAVAAFPGANSQAAFSAAGIYLVDLVSGQAERLVTQPEGAMIGWPYFTADGTSLVYGLAVPQPPGDTRISVRARSLSDGADWALVEGLPGPPVMRGRMEWEQVLAFHP